MVLLFCNPESLYPGWGGPPDLPIDYSGEELEVLIKNLVRDLESAHALTSVSSS